MASYSFPDIVPDYRSNQAPVTRACETKNDRRSGPGPHLYGITFHRRDKAYHLVAFARCPVCRPMVCLIAAGRVKVVGGAHHRETTRLSIPVRAVQEAIDLAVKGRVNFVSASDDICGVLTVEAKGVQTAQRYENCGHPDSVYPINLSRRLRYHRTAMAWWKWTIKNNRTCSTWTSFER